MQSQAAALKGRGQDLSTAIGSLEPFARQAEEALRILDSDEAAVRGLVSNGGEVFSALSERQGQLSGLIRATRQVFETTSNRNQELEEIFRIFPTFLMESRLTLGRLEEFAIDTDPLVNQLRPAVKELSPTLESLGDLSPDLQSFLLAFDDTITASEEGLPALQRLLDDDLRPLLARIDPYFADVNAFLETVGLYRTELAALIANGAAASNGALNEGEVFRHLRTSAVFGPQTLAAYDNRLRPDRSNPYLKPLAYLELETDGLDSFETRHCGAAGDQALLDDGDAGAFPGDLYERLKLFAFSNQNDSDNIPAPPCTQQPDYQSIGINPEQTQYLRVREKE
jgi:phospholipid/cholesterol/gamma-HCH transport system substrate-binding protein